MGFPTYCCSNCDPEACLQLVKYMHRLTIDNFDLAIEDPNTLMDLPGYIAEVHKELPMVRKKASQVSVSRDHDLDQITQELLKTFEKHYYDRFGRDDRLTSMDYFSEEDAWRIVSKMDTIQTSADVWKILKCDILIGGVEKLFECLRNWRDSCYGQKHYENLETLRRQNEERAEEEQNQAWEKEVEKIERTKQNQENIRLAAEAKMVRDTTRKRKAEAKEADQKKTRLTSERNKRMLSGLKTGKSL